MNISNSSKKILHVFFEKPNQRLFINEIIRATGMFPNSVQRALLTLEKQKILKKTKKGIFVFYSINKEYKYLKEVKSIVQGLKEKKGNDSLWVKILNRRSSFAFTEALARANQIGLEKLYATSIKNIWYNDITFGVYYIQNDLQKLGKTVSIAIEKDLEFAKKDITNCKQTCDVLTKMSHQISSYDLNSMSEKQLTKLLEDFYIKYVAAFPFVTVPHAIERFFETKIREHVKKESDYEILSSPTSFVDDEQESALKLASYAKKEGFNKEFEKRLTKHYLDYCWMPLWSIHAKPLEREYFRQEIENILSKVKNPEKELKKLKEEERKKIKEIDSLLKSLETSQELIEHIKLLQEYTSLRVYRKNAISQANYYHLPLLYEIGKRLNLSNEEVKLFSYPELLDGLKGKKSQKSLKANAKKRLQGYAILVKDGKFRCITGVKNIIETMERYRIISPSNAMQRNIKGRIACSGKVSGTVKVVTKLAQLKKVKRGDILVSKMTTPDYMVAIHNAAAIVTDEGGVTCHAAIVSREFNIPCITGTRNATQILSDGDIVEVDANEGVVRVLENVEIPTDVEIINGKSIYNGKVKGIARIVLDSDDFSKVKSGDILITPQTTPEYLSLLYRVKGFVVDEESTTSHAVLYGNALRLPSIMGTQYARNAIQDGEKIELDATNGFLKRTGNE